LKPKKILLVANTAWSLYNFRKGLVRALIAEGYEVVLAAPLDEYVAHIVAEGWSFVELKSLERWSESPVPDLRLWIELTLLYKRIKPDFIIHYTIKPNIYGSFAAKIWDIPHLSLVTGLGHIFETKANFTNFIARKLYQIASIFPVKMGFLNTNDRDFFIEKKWIAPEKTIFFPSEGIDTTHFAPMPKNTTNVATNTENSPFTFLLLSRILWTKGMGEYAKAARILKQKYPNLRFQLLGFIDLHHADGVPPDEIQRWHEADWVEYLGSAADVRPYISAADVVVLPSYYGEGIPRCLLEAAALERPILTTNHVGCKEVVDDGKNGLLCLPQNADDLVAKMQDFIHFSVEKRIEMGKNGREKIKNEFDEKVIIQIYLDFLRDFFAQAQSNTHPKTPSN
jgi:glycosyltransferase involved in cell wall biosynthesis